MANLTVPSPGKWILDMGGKSVFDIFLYFGIQNSDVLELGEPVPGERGNPVSPE